MMWWGTWTSWNIYMYILTYWPICITSVPEDVCRDSLWNIWFLLCMDDFMHLVTIKIQILNNKCLV